MAANTLRSSLCLLLIVAGALEATRCWQFTWPGVIDWSNPTDNSTSCDERAKPCIEPFVLSMNQTPPNLTKLEELCGQGGCPAELWCNTKSGESCVKWVFWTTDVTTNDLKMVNYSLFCGTAHRGDNATKVYDKAVRDGCYKQWLGNLILETCFCYDVTQCNGAGGVNLSACLLVALLFLAVSAPGILRP